MLALVFRPLIHLELTFMCTRRYEVRFILLCVCIQLFQHYLLKRLNFPPSFFLKINWLSIYGLISLFYSIDLCLYILGPVSRSLDNYMFVICFETGNCSWLRNVGSFPGTWPKDKVIPVCKYSHSFTFLYTVNDAVIQMIGRSLIRHSSTIKIDES